MTIRKIREMKIHHHEVGILQLCLGWELVGSFHCEFWHLGEEARHEIPDSEIIMSTGLMGSVVSPHPNNVPIL